MSGLWDSFWPVLAALLPSIGLGYLFWVIMKHIVEGDRRERAALREWEARQDRQARESAADGEAGVRKGSPDAGHPE